jgi:Ca-activated chloride channel family protein
VPQYFDTDIEPATAYYYILKSVAGKSVSAASEEKRVVVAGQRSKKATPPAIKRVTSRSSTEFGKTSHKTGLEWEEVDGAIAYNVYRSTTPDGDYELVQSTSENQSVDMTVEPGKKYYYRVSVLDETFQESQLSDKKEVEVRTPAKRMRKKRVQPTAPTEPRPDISTLSKMYGVGEGEDPHEAAKGRDCKDCHDPALSGKPAPRGWSEGKEEKSKWNFADVAAHRGVNESADCTGCHGSPKDDKPESAAQALKVHPTTGVRGSESGLAGKVAEQTAPMGEDAPALKLPPPPPEAKKMQPEFYLAAKLPTSGPRARRGTSPEPTYTAFGETFDEVWVVQRIEKDVVPEPGKEWPGGGELRAVLSDKEQVAVPLRHTDVKAEISGYVAQVKVKQEYQNPYDSKIEAVYVFPLPQNAAVSDFVMTIGDRRIRGMIREREEAQRIYREAKRQGYTASLLTQERPNIFAQKVANIEPGKAIDIEITYFNTLAYSEGEYTFVFPMVVGPRFNPPGSSDGVGAVSRGAAGKSGQRTEVQYLRPEERSGHDIMVAVDLDAAVEIEKTYSNSHAIDVWKKGKTSASVRLRRADTIPNKDFVLRYKVAGPKVKSALMVDRDDRGGYFTLMLQPPENLRNLPRSGMEMVFVLDTSGSMSGWPTAKARAVLKKALRNLEPADTFQIVRFAGDATTFVPAPVAATTDNIESALSWLDNLRSGGGTHMIRGIQRALDFPHDPNRLRIVSFMTDGYIGNESQIFRAVAEKLGPARIFSFGIGNSVNRYLIEGLARLGHGAVAYVLTGDSDTEAVDQFYERIRHPALTDIGIDWGGMEVSEMYPKSIPDLFVGRPVIVTGRFRGHGDTTVRVRGRCAGEPQEMRLMVAMDSREGRHPGISRIWARARIAELSDTMATGGPASLRDQIRETALAYGIMSPYTAFVAVDSTRRTAGDYGTTVNVPVPVPLGVKYETTVTE